LAKKWLISPPKGSGDITEWLEKSVVNLINRAMNQLAGVYKGRVTTGGTPSAALPTGWTAAAAQPTGKAIITHNLNSTAYEAVITDASGSASNSRICTVDRGLNTLTIYTKTAADAAVDCAVSFILIED